MGQKAQPSNKWLFPTVQLSRSTRLLTFTLERELCLSYAKQGIIGLVDLKEAKSGSSSPNIAQTV